MTWNEYHTWMYNIMCSVLRNPQLHSLRTLITISDQYQQLSDLRDMNQ